MEVEKKRKRFVHAAEGEAELEKKAKAGDYRCGEKAASKRDHCGGDPSGGDDDDEVEEFFAILRRIHVAVKYFEKDGGSDGNRATKSRRSISSAAEVAKPWSPSFVKEDFKAVNGGGEGKGEETVRDNVGLDLNADPVSEE